jgi:hypothetical protein
MKRLMSKLRTKKELNEKVDLNIQKSQTQFQKSKRREVGVQSG